MINHSGLSNDQTDRTDQRVVGSEDLIEHEELRSTAGRSLPLIAAGARLIKHDVVPALVQRQTAGDVTRLGSRHSRNQLHLQRVRQHVAKRKRRRKRKSPLHGSSSYFLRFELAPGLR